jgi:hypothetical protein
MTAAERAVYDWMVGAFPHALFGQRFRFHVETEGETDGTVRGLRMDCAWASSTVIFSNSTGIDVCEAWRPKEGRAEGEGVARASGTGILLVTPGRNDVICNYFGSRRLKLSLVRYKTKEALQISFPS